jgi:hypothetical protein
MSLAVCLIAIAMAQGAPADESARKKEAEQRPRKLDLGPYGAPTGGTPQVEAITDLPRFESTIEVEGRAPLDLNQTMSIWWEHFNISQGAIYGRGTAFRTAPPQGSVDIVPLVTWVADKVRDYKRNRVKAPSGLPVADPSPPGPSPYPGLTLLPENAPPPTPTPTPTPKP